LFDCDGVILDSNQLKTDAFFKVAKKFNLDSALELAAYNKAHGGVSRSIKFKHYIEKILPKYKQIKLSVDQLTYDYSLIVKEELLKCNLSPALRGLKDLLKSNWAVISGGDQDELRQVFKERAIEQYFDLGVWGGPLSKFDIVKMNFIHFSSSNVLFLGDSELDYQVAKFFGFDFMFIYGWSELQNWENFVSCNSLNCFESLEAILVEN